MSDELPELQAKEEGESRASIGQKLSGDLAPDSSSQQFVKPSKFTLEGNIPLKNKLQPHK